MAHIIRMADNIRPIEPGYEAIAGYTAGHWPTANEQWFKDYHAKHKVTISIWGGVIDNAEALDCEPGDEWPITLRIADWVRRQHARGITCPALYVSASYADALVYLLTHHGLVLNKHFKVWTAHYGIGPHLCGVGCNLVHFKVAATQYTSTARSQSLDESLAMESFFDFSTPAVQPVPVDPWHLHLFDTTWRHLAGQWMNERDTIKLYHETIHEPDKHQHLNARDRAMVLFDRLWSVAHTGANGEALPKGDWLAYNRGARAQGLLHAAKGTL